VKRNFRLTRSSDIQRVRRLGRSYTHQLVVLIALQSNGPVTRFGVIAGKSVGGAVQRNRAKRLIRESLRMVHPAIVQGYDLLLIARKPLPGSNFLYLQKAIDSLLTRAELKL
jgi:ribonuclease P protein component